MGYSCKASKISKFFYLTKKKRSFKLKVEDKHRIIENKLALLIKYYHMVNNKTRPEILINCVINNFWQSIAITLYSMYVYG